VTIETPPSNDPSPSHEERGRGRMRAGDSVLAPDVDPTARAEPAEPGAPVPDLERTKRAIERPASRSIGVTVLAVLAVLYTLYFARDFLIPIVFALLLDFFFSPVVRALARWRIRPPLGAGIVVLGVVGLVGLGAYELSEPVERWAAQAPQTVATAERKLKALLKPLERVSSTAEQVERATTVGDRPPTRVVVQGPSLLSRVFGTTQRFVVAVIETLILLYFLLAAGDLFLQKLLKVLPNWDDKHTAVQVARKIEVSISTYLVTAFAVNVGEGLVVAGTMYLIGLPNPLLWGALVVVLEFIPYIGAGVIAIILALAGLTTFDSVGQAMLAPALFLGINVVQGNVVSPMLHADRLTLNPVAIIVGLSLLWRVWGIPGAFVAVPLLAAFKIVCDHVAVLAPIGEFLGGRDERERRTIVREASAPAPGG
jgi:predicted PurR-regulated permease PerM